MIIFANKWFPMFTRIQNSGLLQEKIMNRKIFSVLSEKRLFAKGSLLPEKRFTPRDLGSYSSILRNETGEIGSRLVEVLTKCGRERGWILKRANEGEVENP